MKLRVFFAASLLSVTVAAPAVAHETAEAHQHGGVSFWVGVLAVAVVATGLLVWLRSNSSARD